MELIESEPQGLLPDFGDVEAAARTIERHILHTPLLRSIELDKVTGGEIFVKAECLQITGSFKLRGAFNRLSQLSPDEKARGVVACSSGNHGQAVAYAAKQLGMTATIVMPTDAPAIKVEKTRSHGPKIVTYDRYRENREEIAGEISVKSGAVFVSPYNDRYVIAGQGTSALEAMADMAALSPGGAEGAEGVVPDAYLVNCGGGGLLAGSALVISHLSPATAIYSVEPEDFDDYSRSLAAGERIPVAAGVAPSICDALLTPMAGELGFEINRDRVTGGLTVSDDEVCFAMAFAAQHLKLVVEPGGAAALAAVLSGKLDTRGKSIGLIISGGNVDPIAFAEVLSV